MSMKIYAKQASRTTPLRAGEFGEASADLEKISFEEDDEFAEEGGKAPEQYYESEFETTTVRCCGAFCCVILGVFALSWIVHAIPVSTVTDIPPFAKSMIWMSIAHHTDAWQQAQGAYSPPPPAFGDGLGHFPDQ